MGTNQRLVTVLTAQVRPVAHDPPACLDVLERVARTACGAFPKVDLLLFPELFVSGVDPFAGQSPPSYEREVAEPIPGPTTERLAKVAQQEGRFLAAGSMYEREGDEVFNTALVFSPAGELVARHRKVFPWRPWEGVARGSGLTTFDIAGMGRFGLMICYEGWFPEVARGLALLGAEAILQPSATTTPDREEELVLARANAITNQCFVLNVNAATTIGGGRSVGFDPEGRLLFEGGSGEELILEVIDLARSETVRKRGTRGMNPVLQELREAPPEFVENYARTLRGGA
jgi:formamidase